MKFKWKIVYETASLLLVEKPQGLATTPGNQPDLCTQFFRTFPQWKDITGYRPGEGGLLNRLDNDTGGLLIFSKSNEAFNYYAEIMQNGAVEKTYHAIVHGTPGEEAGMIDLPIAHHHKNRRKMAVVTPQSRYRSQPRRVITRWKLLQTNGDVSLLKVVITKGMRHQIRIHLAYLGCPLVGDKLYQGDYVSDEPWHLLYASGLKLNTMEGEMLNFNVTVPFVEQYFPD